MLEISFKYGNMHNFIAEFNHSFAPANVSGVNFWAAPMFPLIFIFPCMNAVWGFKVLVTITL